MILAFNLRLNMTIANRQHGFTLIELITVMSIMAIVLSLVGPLTVNFIDKAQAQSEFIDLKNTLKKASYLSFASATPQMFIFNDKALIIRRENREDKRINFEYLSFGEQQVFFNSRGYTHPETLLVSMANKDEAINLFRLVEGSDVKISKP